MVKCFNDLGLKTRLQDEVKFKMNIGRPNHNGTKVTHEWLQLQNANIFEKTKTKHKPKQYKVLK